MTKADRTEPKSGFLTSEFVLALTITVMASLLLLMGKLDADAWMLATGINGLGYTAGRTATKISGK